eukprot:330810-Pleurochrysis_carterae.AAC.4
MITAAKNTCQASNIPMSEVFTASERGPIQEVIRKSGRQLRQMAMTISAVAQQSSRWLVLTGCQ